METTLPFLEVWDDLLPPALLSRAIEQHREVFRLTNAKDARGDKAGRRDASLGWIDVRAEPGILDKPRDYMEALAASVVGASPALQQIASELDVVEFFMHDRPQDLPQWFHYDTAEYAHFDVAEGRRTVRNPSYSAIVYLSDEDEAHFGLLHSRLDCASKAADDKVAASTGRGPGGSSETLAACTPDAVRSLVPGVARSGIFVRPKRGRVVVIDGSVLHGTMPGMRLPHHRTLIGLCFFRARPTLPPPTTFPTLQGQRTLPQFALPPALLASDAVPATTGVAVDAHGQPLQQQDDTRASRSDRPWSFTHGASPRLLLRTLSPADPLDSLEGGTAPAAPAAPAAAAAAAAAAASAAALVEVGQLPAYTAAMAKAEIEAAIAADEHARPRPAWRLGNASGWPGFDMRRAGDRIEIKVSGVDVQLVVRMPRPPARVLASWCSPACQIGFSPAIDLSEIYGTLGWGGSRSGSAPWFYL